MRYADGRDMSVGDVVVADGMDGTVVCDFDRRRYAAAYEDWDPPPGERSDDGVPSTGLMIRTAEAGLIHYAGPDVEIDFVRASPA